MVGASEHVAVRADRAGRADPHGAQWNGRPVIGTDAAPGAWSLVAAGRRTKDGRGRWASAFRRGPFADVEALWAGPTYLVPAWWRVRSITLLSLHGCRRAARPVGRGVVAELCSGMAHWSRHPIASPCRAVTNWPRPGVGSERKRLAGLIMRVTPCALGVGARTGGSESTSRWSDPEPFGGSAGAGLYGGTWTDMTGQPSGSAMTPTGGVGTIEPGPR